VSKHQKEQITNKIFLSMHKGKLVKGVTVEVLTSAERIGFEDGVFSRGN